MKIVLADVLNQKFESIKIEQQLLPQQKIIIEVEPRNPLETVQYLYSNKKVPCHIEAREGHDILHFTMHYNQIRTLRRMRDLYTRPIYIKLGAEEIRTTLKQYKYFNAQQFFEVAIFRRYVVGQPNRVKIPVYFENVKHFRME